MGAQRTQHAASGDRRVDALDRATVQTILQIAG
jgi:hypothetical protein